MTITADARGKPRSDSARRRACLCAQTAEDHRGRDVLILDLRGITPITDFFVIATGTSRRQIHTMAEEIDRAMNEHGETKIGIEGYNESRWVLLDYGDIVVHLFDESARRYYDIENLWGDAPRVDWARPHTGPSESLTASASEMTGTDSR